MRIAARLFLLLGCLCWLAPSAAVQRSEDGFGDVLLFPHAGGTAVFDGLLSLWPAIGATDFGGQVPVVARVLVHRQHGSGLVTTAAVTVFLAGNDGWTAALFGTGLGTALSSPDRSCAFDRSGNPLPDGAALLLSGGLGDGWIEAYELGAVTDRAIATLAGERDCDALAAALPDAPGDWLGPPANRLRGALHLVDLDSGTSFSLAPTALRNFRDAPWWQGLAGTGPSLAEPRPPIAVVRLPDGSLRTSTFSAHPVDAVSAVLADSEWELDFSVEAAIAATTDVIVLAPTQPWYADGRAPFAGADGPVIAARVHDREGRVVTHPQAKCSPMPPLLLQDGPVVDAPLQVIELGPHGVLESARAFPMQYVLPDGGSCFRQGGALWEHVPAGRMALYFDRDPGAGVLRSDEGHEVAGLPVIGIGLTSALGRTHAGRETAFGLLQLPSRRTRYLP